MSEMSKTKTKSWLRVGLLALHILLPLGLYLAMNGGYQIIAVIIAGLFSLSMLALVVFK